MTTPKKRLTVILFTIPFLLLIPYLAMQFTNEVNWTVSDFIVMGILLLTTGLGIEFVIRKAKKNGVPDFAHSGSTGPVFCYVGRNGSRDFWDNAGGKLKCGREKSASCCKEHFH